MSTPGDAPRPSGFLNNMRAAYTPRPVSEEEASGPLVLPKTVLVTRWLLIVVGAVFVFSAILVAFTRGDIINTWTATNVADVQSCQTEFTGVGETLTTTATLDAAAQARFDACKGLKLYTAADWDSVKSGLLLNGIIFGLLGLGLLYAGWYLTSGKAMPRRIATIVAVLVFAIIMFGASFGLSLMYIWNLPAVLVLIIGVALLYSGKGGRYFALARLREITGPAKS